MCKQAAGQSIDNAATLYGQAGVSQATTTSVTDQFKQLVSIAPYLAPGLVGMASILFASCAAGLAHLIFPRMGSRRASPLSLSKFRLHWALAYVSIAGLALLLLARGSGEWQSALRYVGIDMLLVSQTLFFLQGLAVCSGSRSRESGVEERAAGFMRRRSSGRPSFKSPGLRVCSTPGWTIENVLL